MDGPLPKEEHRMGKQTIQEQDPPAELSDAVLHYNSETSLPNKNILGGKTRG